MCKIQIVYKNVNELIPYINNPRVNDQAVDKVASSIKNFGFKVPIVLDSKNEIVTGHTRLKAAKKLGLKEVPCIIADDLTQSQIKAFRIADNKVSEFSEWDIDLLNVELDELDLSDISMADFGFDEMNQYDVKEKYNEYESGSLKRDFIFPPFSILDSTSSEWQNRKNEWISLGIKSEVGRGGNLAFTAGLNSGNLKGTSIFDPVLCELMYRWFCPINGKIVDSFAGGSVRGIVAAKLGHEYIGIDLRKEQIDANKKNAKQMELDIQPVWYCDDSQNIDKYIEDDSMDFSLLCPPYYDLEVYSEDERDISNMDYDSFKEIYSNILRKTAKKIKNNRFFVVVISDVRDKKGYYRGLCEVTKNSLENEDFLFYNDIILKNALGTAGLRTRNAFKNRKVTRIHQNVLVFYKGDIKKIQDDFPEITSDDLFNETNIE
ncbi:ParB N-terminal domain-containing protein [Helcococcus kunzii]|uniref:ParB N-terminal domain-containing protein n=1 Tax=Helcococcus kunzii TaxID=40091 RepID=UPI00389C88FF